MRAGDKHRTNRMFWRRIYAQAFTILAVVGGSFYWETDRMKRRQYDALVEEKKKKERSEAWLRELEARDQEEQELRRMRDKLIREQAKERRYNSNEQASDMLEQVKSVWEETESTGDGPILAAAKKLWRSR